MAEMRTQGGVSTKMRMAPTAEPVVDAIELLASQHREVEALFREIGETERKDHKNRKRLVEALAAKVTLHAKIEEKVF